MSEKFLNHIVPYLIQRFIQGKGFQGSTCGTGQGFAIILKVQKQTENVLTGKRKGISLKQFFCIFFGKTEYNFKVQGCFFPFHHGKTKGLDIPPESIVLLLCQKRFGILGILEICM